MKIIILATTNAGKAREIQSLLGTSYMVQTLADVGFDEEIAEDGATFRENAVIKAEAVRNSMAHDYDFILADDSGLMIDALDGMPGVRSARWLGASTPYAEKNAKILEMMKDVPEELRTARFACVMACVDKTGQLFIAEGTLEGRIAFEAAGENGFGYDPIFFLPEMDCTMAQIITDEKNRISHRAQALQNIIMR